MKTILLSGYYGFGNLGDEALLAGTLQMLRSRAPDLRTIVLSAAPSQTRADHSVEALQRWNLREVLPAMRRSDLFVSGGGGLVQDATSWRSPLYYLGLIGAARLLRKPVMIYAQGIGPLRHRVNVELARRLFSAACAITVRDEHSAQWLRRHRVRTPVTVTADPSLALDPAPDTHVTRLLEAESVRVGPETVIVALRKWRGNVNFAARASVEFKHMVHKLGVEIVLLPMHHPGDVALARRVAQQAGTGIAVLDRRLQPAEALGVISRAGAVVGMRLHALILGVAAARPVLGIGYDPKVAAFAESVGCPAPVDPEDIGTGRITERFGDLWRKRDSESRRLAALGPLLKQRAEENVNVLTALLEG